MALRGIWMTFLAGLLGAVLVHDAVAAYPTTARSGTTTVTGVYRPLDLNLSLVDGTNALDYCYACYGFGSQTYFNYSATYQGTYSGYSQTGASGEWRLSLGLWTNNEQFTDDGTTITVTPGTTFFPIGSLTYQGGGNYAGVPYADTPQLYDTFDLYPTLGGATDPLLEVTCTDGTGSCTSFVMRLLQNIVLQGPFIYTGGEGRGLDDGTAQFCDWDWNTNTFTCSEPGPNRVNQACLDAADGRCGLIPAENFRASSTEVPEPGSLALVGLGLAAMVVSGRRLIPSRPRRQPTR